MSEPVIPAAREGRSWPPGLRDRILGRALDARDAGRPVNPPADIPPVEAFRRTILSMETLLQHLLVGEWRRPALRDLTVQGLVGHLIGVERDFIAALLQRTGAEGSVLDHISATQGNALAQLGRPPDQTLHDWRQETRTTLGLVVANRSSDAVSVHGVTLPVQDFLIVRAFEMWTHEEDIRAATGREPTLPDDSTLALMTKLATTLLPVGMARSGRTAPADVRLVLTGRGGGTFEISLPGPQEAPVDRVRLVMDTAQFCRVVANRLEDGDVAMDVVGDPDLAAQTLAGARALALD